MITLNANTYYSGLQNFIVFMRMYATNTSKKEKTLTDVFCSETLEFGDQKVFPFAEIPKVEDYSLTSTLLSDKPIKYSEEFIGDPIKKKISLSQIDAFLKMAMLNSSGMKAFSSYIYGLMETAKEDYLYNEIMKDIISWAPTNSVGKEMKQEVELLDVDGFADDPLKLNAAELQNQKRIALKLQKMYDDFSLYTDVFLDIDNTSGSTNFKSAVNLSDLIFISNAKYINEQTINMMATLLKSDKIDDAFHHPKMIKIPQRTFDGNSASDTIGFVVHRHWYQWFYHFTFMGSFFDPDTVRMKRILHFWYSKGRLKNLPAARLDAKTAGA